MSVGGHSCRFLISKLVWCVESLCSLLAANKFTLSMDVCVCVSIVDPKHHSE